MRRSRCWKNPKISQLSSFLHPPGPARSLHWNTAISSRKWDFFPCAIVLFPRKLLVLLSLQERLCRCINVSRTIRKINCFCFYISIVTEAKELEKMNPWFSDLHCPQVSIYRDFPIPWEGAGNLHQSRVCTRSFHLKSRDFGHWTNRSIAKIQEYPGDLDNITNHTEASALLACGIVFSSD